MFAWLFFVSEEQGSTYFRVVRETSRGEGLEEWKASLEHVAIIVFATIVASTAAITNMATIISVASTAAAARSRLRAGVRVANIGLCRKAAYIGLFTWSRGGRSVRLVTQPLTDEDPEVVVEPGKLNRRGSQA